MTDRQVLIFGSFTEEETRSLQWKPQKNDVGFIFGSLDSEALRSVGIFETKLHSTKGSDLQTNKQSVCRIVSNGEKSSRSPVDLVVENGCAVANANDSARELKPGRVSSGLTSDNLSSFQHSDPEVELSSSLDDVVLNDSTNSQESNGSISNVPNGKHIVVPRNFVPRGLVNLGNLCFLNATLQALLSCSPFFQLLQELRHCKLPEIDYPTLCAFVDFVSHFDIPTDSIGKRNEKSVLETGPPFRPVMFDSILKIFTPDIPDNLSGRPRQEDAQEFLSFVMHQMHDELLKLHGQISNGNGKIASLVSSTDDESEDDSWETVCPRNKAAVTRTQSFMPSKLSAIFGGQLRSVVKARGFKASATVQPFLLLHLNIFPDPVCSIEDALQLFSAPEMLEGYQTSAAGKGEVVSASKCIKILELSEIMVLHLMRFSYGSQGCTKLHKAVHFPLELIIDRELLASPPSMAKTYELVATITHHGRDPSRGHYTADARHPNGKWLRYDDASVKPIPENDVLHDQAYVLFYKQL